MKYWNNTKSWKINKDYVRWRSNSALGLEQAVMGPRKLPSSVNNLKQGEM